MLTNAGFDFFGAARCPASRDQPRSDGLREIGRRDMRVGAERELVVDECERFVVALAPLGGVLLDTSRRLRHRHVVRVPTASAFDDPCENGLGATGATGLEAPPQASVRLALVRALGVVNVP